MKMNKKILALLLAVGFMAGTQAFASRARLLVLGTGDAGQLLDGYGNGGSLLVDDAYNMFYNPAYVNDYKDWAIIEKTGGTMMKENGTAGSTTRAQGGFVTSVANLNMGLYLNRVTPLDSWKQTNAVNMHPVDFTIGGDMGVKWGLGLSYASYKNLSSSETSQVDQSATNLDVRFGISHEGFEPFVSYKVVGKEKLDAVERKHKDLMIGTRYHYGEWTPYLAVRKTQLENVTTRMTWGFGTARKMKVA